MLILNDSIYNERRRLWHEHESGKLTDEACYRQLLALDPDDFMALTGLARVFQDAGDYASAERYFWRAIEANPCVDSPYIGLARLLHLQPESRALVDGLSELGLLKQLRDPENQDILDDLLSANPEQASEGMPEEGAARLRDLPTGERSQLMAYALRQNREGEAAWVTEKLRLLRLVEDMQEQGEMDTAMVDEFIAAGSEMVPLLIGVMRAWVQDFLGEDGDFDCENATALLGEIGTPAEIPCLLEFVDLENEVASGASSWALGRIMQRLPEEAARFLESIIPSLGMRQRLKIAELITADGGFDPENRLFFRLSEDLGAMDQAERDRYLPLLLVAMAANPSRGGVRTARAILGIQGAQISRKARRECEELLSLFHGVDTPPREVSRPTPTVYDICAGNAVWDTDEGEDDEETDDDFLIPEPIRRQPRPGRNDPCWCNSGKKYKKCHLESDEQQDRQPRDEGSSVAGSPKEFGKLRRSIGEFLGQVLKKDEMQDAFLEFFGDNAEEADLSNEEMSVTEWMIHDWIAPRLGRTVLDQFLIQRGARLTEREREMVAAWSRSFVGFYEIQHLKADAGAELKEIFSGETFFVHDVSLSRSGAKWDGMLARVVPGERGLELAAVVRTVPRPHMEPLREWMKGDRDEQDLAWPEYLKANWPRIRRQANRIAMEWLDGLRLANTSGEELLLSKAGYEVLDETKVIAALREAAELTEDSGEDEPRKRFVWLDDRKTVLGTIRVADGQLIFETISRQRHERGETLITGLVGDYVRHLRDEMTPQQEMKRRAMAGPPDSGEASGKLPAEVTHEILAKVGEQHYLEWLDTSVPALGGKTPRQAAQTPKGRRELTEVLKFVENLEDRKRQRGEPFMEMARIRRDLGLG